MSFLYRRAWEIKRAGKHDKWEDEGGRRREYLDIASCALGTARGRNALSCLRASTAPCQSAWPCGSGGP
jgi:hypothetical protein